MIEILYKIFMKDLSITDYLFEMPIRDLETLSREVNDKEFIMPFPAMYQKSNKEDTQNQQTNQNPQNNSNE